MPQSQWYLINQVAVGQLQALADGLAVTFLDNPALPIDMGKDQTRALFMLPRGDKLIDQPGQQPERRVMRMVVGASALTKAPLATADELHFAARDRLKSLAFRQALLPVAQVAEIREVEIEPELKDIATTGSVLMSAYEIEYLQSYPSFA